MKPSLIEELDREILSGTPASRERALWHATEMLMVGRYTDEEIWVFGEVIGRLAKEIETGVRAKLAGELSRIDQAPVELIKQFASDDAIEVAGPALRYSEKLDVRTLVAHARTKSQQHLLAISRRRSLPEPVTDVLVVSGDEAVARAVTTNSGARFSEAGFLTLIKRSENDSILAEQIGQRKDIPRHLFQQLIAKASDEVRRKLEGERPDVINDIDATVAEVTASLHAKFGPASARYFAAKRLVMVKHRLGELGEGSVFDYARSHKTEEAIVALALLCSLSADVVERALIGKSRELLLVIAKAVDFSWNTTMALLFLGAPDFRMSSYDLDEHREQFSRLHVSSSQDALAHYRKRRTESSTVTARHLPI